MLQGKELTRAELEIMQILWLRDGQFLSDIISAIQEPRPAYTTVSTIVRILVKKGFVSHSGHGKQYCYSPTITKEEYTEAMMSRMKTNFFEGSVANMISFFARKEKLSQSEIEELIELIEKDK